MKARYLAAALVGAWLMRRRARNTARQRVPYRGAQNQPVAGTPFRLHKNGVRKPEDVPHAPPPAGGGTDDIPAM